MVCRAATYQGGHETDVLWSNWSGRVTYRIGEFWQPASLPELVDVVARATETGNETHALGSGWGFDDLATSAAWVVSLERLDASISVVVDGALTDAWRARQDDPNGDLRLLHVEAGIEVGVLNERLAAQGLAMITLGGANGQNLVGALSTSTHGGDVALPPLCDLVEALHLVTDGGREIWLERGSAPVTVDDRLRAALPCADTRIVRDDDVFNAALVSVGRFGIVYSVVLRVRRAYRLAEWTVLVPRASVIERLLAGVTSGRGLTPLLESLAAPPQELGASGGEIPTSPRFVELFFNSLDPAQCFIRRRWPTGLPADLNLDFSEPFPCNPGQPQALLAFSAMAIRGAAGGLAAVPVIGLVWAAQALANATALDALVGRSPDGGQAMAACLTAAWNSRLGFVAPVIANHVFGNRFAASAAAGRRGRSDLIMTNNRAANQSTCYRGDSAEIVFSAESRTYLDFLGLLLDAGPTFQHSGYVSVRFCAPSAASLSMHHLPGALTASVEVSMLGGLPGNGAWLEFVERTGVNLGGRPHWGQVSTLTAAQVEGLYGPDLERWRAALAAVSGTSRLFSNAYTRRRGLEPAEPATCPELRRRIGSGRRSVAGLLEERRRLNPRDPDDRERIAEINATVAQIRRNMDEARAEAHRIGCQNIPR